MRIGSGIFLLVLGAILTFAVNVEVEYVNLDLIGWICMAAGVLVLIFGIVALTRTRSSVATSRTTVDPVSGDKLTHRTAETDDPAAL
jgi:membrane-bound ClpP family serine protease